MKDPTCEQTTTKIQRISCTDRVKADRQICSGQGHGSNLATGSYQGWSVRSKHGEGHCTVLLYILAACLERHEAIHQAKRFGPRGIQDVRGVSVCTLSQRVGLAASSPPEAHEVWPNAPSTIVPLVAPALLAFAFSTSISTCCTSHSDPVRVHSRQIRHLNLWTVNELTRANTMQQK